MKLIALLLILIGQLFAVVINVIVLSIAGAIGLGLLIVTCTYQLILSTFRRTHQT